MPVCAPLAVHVCCVLLVLVQLYRAIPLAPVVAAEFGGDGAPALDTAYSVAYALGSVVDGGAVD